jgi:hypothetical protein
MQGFVFVLFFCVWWYEKLNLGPLELHTLALVIFRLGSHFFLLADLDHSPIYACHIAGMTGMHHHAQLLVETWSLE